MSRRKAAAAAPVEEPEEEDEPSNAGLRFNEPLSWRAGSKPSTGELLRRLELLAQELKELDQEDIDRDALTRPAKDLVHQNLLQHKDKGVRAWTACCIADIFKLCAPEAPFTAAQLKEIFTVIITSIIPALSDPTDPYNSQHLYVLLSLAQVKSIVLLTDVPSSNQLILRLFETCFDVLSTPGQEMSKNIEYHMTSILECMIDETQGLPTEVIEIILAQFMRVDQALANGPGSKAKKTAAAGEIDTAQSTLSIASNSAAYNMAKNVANTCVDRMSRYVTLYFGNVIMNATTPTSRPKHTKAHKSRKESSPVDDSDIDEQAGPDEEGLKQLEKAHRLLRELWRSAPGIVHNMIPQIEAELSAENVDIRIIATEAIGDMVSGIGAAGLPPATELDPAMYPSMTLSSAARDSSGWAGPAAPSAPQSFSQAHPIAYQSFLGRQKDKSPLIRAAWTKGIGRILSTSAGGIGLETQEERDLIGYLAEKVMDTDERVRIAAIESVAQMRFLDVINKISSTGGVSDEGSVLYNIAQLTRDRKHNVRIEVMLLLGKLWGVASGEIASGNENMRKLLGAIPSAIFNAAYVNEPDVNQLIEKVLYEQFMPMGWPAMKKKSKVANESQDANGSQGNSAAVNLEAQADKLRTERLLTLVRDLTQRAKTVFLAMMVQQKTIGDNFKSFLKKCEEYNGGEVEDDAKQVKADLTKLINFFAKSSPDIHRVSEDLWKFAKNHDRRCYALLRFSMADDSDYSKVHKSMKEIMRRIDGFSSTTGTLPQTLQAILYKISNVLYNRSHIHAIMEFSQSPDEGLAAPAHELLKNISAHRPGVFKAHIQELCRVLQDQAPRPGRDNDFDALDSMKACASFAKRFAKEVSRDPKFIQALMQYATLGSPPAAAKYATAIIMTISDKKELHMKDLLKQCIKGFEYGSPHFLARLACLSQLMLSASTCLDEEKDVDPVIDIAIKEILSRNRTEAAEDDSDKFDQPDEECQAKSWALKLLVNRLRSFDSASHAKDASPHVYNLLNKLIVQEGELIPGTPRSHRSYLHLQAALRLLKLSCTCDFDHVLTPQNFITLATVAQTQSSPIRQAFVTKIQKYLGQGRLPSRFYTIIFLLQFEPTKQLRQDSMTWLKARSQMFAKAKSTTFEVVFSRLLSLLAHHPDFENNAEDLKSSAMYIMFYLKAVATQDNISLIYFLAQRVRGVKDAIDPARSENLYIMSELAQVIIGHFADIHGWSMQAYSGKVGLPKELFDRLHSSEGGHELATKQFLPQELVDDLEALVKESMRPPKKRRSDGDGDQPSKKRATASTTNGVSKPKAMPVRKAKKPAKTPTKKTSSKKREEEEPATERRKSGRASARQTYAERDDNEDDEEMEEAQAEADGDEDEEDEVEDEDVEDAQSELEEQPVQKTKGKAQARSAKKDAVKAAAKAPQAESEVSDDELSDPPESDED